jgi:hypothetical protein
VVGPPGGPLTLPLRLFKAFVSKTLKESAFFPEQFRSATAVEDKFRGTEVSVPAPYRDGEVPSEPSPSVSIAVSTVSIDFSIAVVASYDEEGVVLPCFIIAISGDTLYHNVKVTTGSYVVHLSLP